MRDLISWILVIRPSLWDRLSRELQEALTAYLRDPPPHYCDCCGQALR